MKFEYCECGCRGYFADLGPVGFWIYWDIRPEKQKGKPFQLHEGHGFSSPKIGTYASMADARLEAAQKAKKVLSEMQRKLVA